MKKRDELGCGNADVEREKEATRRVAG